MKIERQPIARKDLCGWALANSPRGLIVKRCGSGYGYVYLVYAEAHPPRFMSRGHPIAELGSNYITLFETNYLSDMKDLALSYEQSTGHEITIKYWQSEKDGTGESI